MSDNFIPLNQSTPVHNPTRLQGQNFHVIVHRGGWRPNLSRGGFIRQVNLGNTSNSSQGKDQSIDAYLHPSMFQDPWAYLRRKMAENQQV